MRVKIITKAGLTLTELLVASILIGIIMIGVASFSVSIQQLHNSTNRTAILAIKTMTAMNHLVRDAYLTIGDESGDDWVRGVVTRILPPRTSLCFRHDADNDPSSYTNDQWTCYYFEENVNKREFSLCTVPTPPGDVPPNNANKCDGAGTRRVLLKIDPAQIDNFFQINEDIDGRLESIDFKLSAIFDHTLPPHPITNPTYTVTTTVSPPGISR